MVVLKALMLLGCQNACGSIVYLLMRFSRSSSDLAKSKDGFPRIGLRWGGLLVYILVVMAPALSEAQTSNRSGSVRFTDVTQAAGIDFVHSRGTRSSLLPEGYVRGRGLRRLR